MASKIRQIGPFLGLMTSVDAHAIPEGYAQSLLNVRIEDGKVRVRYGYGILGSSGHTAPYGLDHLVGYSGTSEVEEYIAALDIGSGVVVAHAIDPTTFAFTEITNGVSRVTLNASGWKSIAFEDKAYLINKNNTPSVYQHTIGSATSMTAITTPVAPTTALRFRPKYSSTSYTTYDVLNWAGLTVTNSSHMNCTGVLSATAGGAAGANTDATLDANGNWFKLRFYSVGVLNGMDGSFTVDLNSATTGVKDWTYNDIFAFVMDFDRQDMEEGSLNVSFFNNDGSPVEIAGTDIQVVKVSETGPPSFRQVWHVRVEFKNKTRTDWDNIRKIKVAFRLVSGEGYDPSYVMVSQFTVGCVDGSHYPASVQDNLQFTYSYRINASGLESDRIGKFVGTVSYPVIVPNTVLAGKQLGFKTEPLGAWIEFTTAASGEGSVDEVRLYGKEQNSWHLVSTQSDATLTQLYRMTIEELRELSTALNSGSNFSSIKGATPFKGWMVWLRAGGRENILHSRIGEALRLRSDSDEVDDPNRGATFSLADNYGDEPEVAFQAGDALIIFGKYGVYAQTGSKPSEMSPCRKIPGSFGIANAWAACRWRDEDGNPGVAFVSRNLEGVYFVQVDQSFDGDQGYRLKELSADIRPTVKVVVAQSTVRLIADEALDALWMVDAGEALVLRRPSIVNGHRSWEYYAYEADTFSYVCSSSKRGKQAITADCQLVQLETNESGTGYVRDASTAPSGGSRLPLSSSGSYGSYWQSKDYVGPNRRVIRCNIHPALTTSVNGPELTVSVEGVDRSDAAVTEVTYTGTGATLSHKRFGYKTQGWQLSYKVTFESYSGSVPLANVLLQRVEFEELTVGGRRLA